MCTKFLYNILVLTFILEFIEACTTNNQAVINGTNSCTQTVPQLNVSLQQGSKNIGCGVIDNVLKALTKNRPTIKFSQAEKGKYYALIMVEPGAPNPQNPTERYWLQWIVTDIPGETVQNGFTDAGNQLVEYSQPTPPIGIHRNQFYLAEQEKGKPTKTRGRGKFNLGSFLANNNLCVVASNQYRVNSGNE